MNVLKALLLDAPETELDSALRPLIQEWDEVPTSTQVLDVIDECIMGACASEFTLTMLETMHFFAEKREELARMDAVMKGPLDGTS